MVCSTPTSTVTALPPATLSPAAGVDLTTFPTSAGSGVSTCDWVPRVSPRSFSACSASATVLPVSGGTAACAGPLPTAIVTRLRSLTCEFGPGSVRSTVPACGTSELTSSTVTCSPAAMRVARATSVRWPTTSGMATCWGCAGPLKIWYATKAMSPSATATPAMIATVRPVRGGGSSSHSPTGAGGALRLLIRRVGPVAGAASMAVRSSSLMTTGAIGLCPLRTRTRSLRISAADW